jgi:hypothetical protein
LKQASGSFSSVYLMIVLAAAALMGLAVILPRENPRATA